MQILAEEKEQYSDIDQGETYEVPNFTLRLSWIGTESQQAYDEILNTTKNNKGKSVS